MELNELFDEISKKMDGKQKEVESQAKLLVDLQYKVKSLEIENKKLIAQLEESQRKWAKFKSLMGGDE